MTLLFVDNDVISKLASCDLVDDALISLNSNRHSVRILSTFKHRFGLTNQTRRSRIEQEIGLATYERILNFQISVGEIPEAPDHLLSPFEDLTEIDVGESQMFASASVSEDVIVVTGDKRSIRCLASSRACEKITMALKHRILCFEQVVKAIITHKGFDYTKHKIVPAVHCDTVLRVIFGTGIDADETNVTFALDGYINELRRSSGDLLQ